MAQPAIHTAEDEGTAAAILDRGHLARMTLGDRALERELLELFDRQAMILLARMRAADPVSLPALAHTLKGSAAGIGAHAVVAAAARAERTVGASAGERQAIIEHLSGSIAAARAEIATRLLET